MNSNFLRTISAGLSLAVVLAGCDGLGKMLKKQKDIKYTLTPNPIEMHGDSITFSVNGKFNPKIFAKKVVLTLTPVVKGTGAEKSLKPIVLVGEKATGSGQKISFSSGGTFAYTSEKFAYTPDMRNAIVELRGEGVVKSKKKSFDPVKMADGTIVTPLLVRNDEKPMFGADAFVKTQPANQSTHIYYTINNSQVRPGELKSDETKALSEFLKANLSSPCY
jgi:hypothetical protein